MNYIINKDKRILVIGDLMLDHYIYGQCNRISPEAPVQVVEVKSEQYTLGGAGNVLKNLRAFNINSGIISVVGNDDNAELLGIKLTDIGIPGYTLVKDEKRCTTVKSRVLVNHHQLIRLDKEETQTIDDNIAQQLYKAFEAEVRNYDIVLIFDYNKGLLSDFLLKSIFTICRELGIKTIVDPKGGDYSKYQRANIIKPNKKEAMLASGITIKDKASLALACAKLKEITACDDVIITMSEEGMAVFTQNELTIIPTKALDVIDVTGAGDTVLASLSLALVSGNSLYVACNFANHAAAVVVSKVGSATATLDEINQKFSEFN